MTCENHQLALSCVLDHELPVPEMPETLDHVLECEACARFYREARRLDGLRETELAATVAAPIHRLTPRRWWPVAIAAALILGFGLSWTRIEWPSAAMVGFQ